MGVGGRGVTMQVHEVNQELLQYCGVAATATRKCEAKLISEDELGHLLQVQIRLARIMLDDAMQQVGAKVGTAAFVDLVDFPGSIVHMYAGGATADGAADRVIQTLERSLAKDAAGVMLQNLFGIIALEEVLGLCLRSHIDAGLLELLPRTLHAVQLLAAVSDLGRRFAAQELGVVDLLLGVLESHSRGPTGTDECRAGADAGADRGTADTVSTERHTVGGGTDACLSSNNDDAHRVRARVHVGGEECAHSESGEGSAVGTNTGGNTEGCNAAAPRTPLAIRRDAIMHRSAATLINLALAVPELRDRLASAAPMQATVAEFFATHNDLTTTVALVYVSTLASISEKRKNALLEGQLGQDVVDCLCPTRGAGIRLRALLAIRNLVCGSKARQLVLLSRAPDTIQRLQVLSKDRTLKESFFEKADDQESGVRKEAKLLLRILIRVQSQQPQVELLKSELATLRTKAKTWAIGNHRRLETERHAAHTAAHEREPGRAPTTADANAAGDHPDPHTANLFGPGQEYPTGTGSSGSPTFAVTPEAAGPAVGTGQTPSTHASNLMELAECSIEDASAVETSPADTHIHRMMSPRRRLLDDSDSPATTSFDVDPFFMSPEADATGDLTPNTTTPVKGASPESAVITHPSIGGATDALFMSS